MPADPSGFDHYRRGEPVRVQEAKADPTSFDHYRRGEPLLMLVTFTAAAAAALPLKPIIALQAVNRSNTY